MQPKHSIIVISYNQAKIIGRALDSLLGQKEFLYEIIISDDCSTDNTWAVVNEYKKKFPDIIKPFRNHQNLGIFGNIESTWPKVSGDIIWYLAGDDTYCQGLFKEANKLVEINRINVKEDSFSLYFDYKTISPFGKEKIRKNNLIKKYNPVSLKLRQLICNRTVGFSRNVLAKFYPVRKDIGINADGLQDIQVQLFSKKNYYSSFVGSTYYTNIGISSTTDLESYIKSYILSLEQLKSDIKPLLKEDKYWLSYLQKKLSFKLNPSFKNYLSYINLFFYVIQKFYGFSFIKQESYDLGKNTIKLFFFHLPNLKRKEI